MATVMDNIGLGMTLLLGRREWPPHTAAQNPQHLGRAEEECRGGRLPGSRPGLLQHPLLNLTTLKPSAGAPSLLDSEHIWLLRAQNIWGQG